MSDSLSGLNSKANLVLKFLSKLALITDFALL